MADTLFFSPTTVTKLTRVRYRFKTPQQRAAAQQFQSELRQAEQELIASGAQYMPLNTIAASIQY